jgi:sodium-dependent dicarboxylate transporter 2/3/5
MTTDSAAIAANSFDWKKYLFMGIGILLFVLVYYSPPWPDAIDPEGKGFALSPEGKGALWQSFCWPPHGGCSRWSPSA